MFHVKAVSSILLILVTTASTDKNYSAALAPTDVCCSLENRQLSKIQQLQTTYYAWLNYLKVQNYTSSAPPNYPDETPVNLYTVPFQLSRVDELGETIKHSQLWYLNWVDARLARRQSDESMLSDTNCSCLFPYRDKIALRLLAGDDKFIWLPKMTLHGRQDPPVTAFMEIVDILISENGLVELKGTSTETRLCRIRTRLFPYDMQDCPLKLEAYQNVRLIHVPPSQEKFDRVFAWIVKNPEMYGNNGWQMFYNRRSLNLTLMQAETDITGEQYHMRSCIVTYSLILKRSASIQHTVNWIVTPVILSVSSAVGMYRGCNVGERYGFGGTIVVTMTLIINELRAVLGVGADGYPILGQMYIGLELTLILATLLSGLPLRWFERCSRLKREKVQREKLQQAAGHGKLLQSMELRLGLYRWGRSSFEWLILSVVLFLQTTVVAVACALWLVDMKQY